MKYSKKKENNSIYKSIKNNNILIKLIKEVKKNLYTDYFKTLIKKIEEDINRTVLCSRIGRINTVKIVHTTQSYLRIPCNLYQNFNGIFHRYRKK